MDRDEGIFCLCVQLDCTLQSTSYRCFFFFSVRKKGTFIPFRSARDGVQSVYGGCPPLWPFSAPPILSAHWSSLTHNRPAGARRGKSSPALQCEPWPPEWRGRPSLVTVERVRLRCEIIVSEQVCSKRESRRRSPGGDRKAPWSARRPNPLQHPLRFCCWANGFKKSLSLFGGHLGSKRIISGCT